MAQRFYHMILLPRVRENLSDSKKLNHQLFEALKKSCYKPGAFYKGIVIPLCEEGDCTRKEAFVIGSVIRKKRLPLLHSAAAILKIGM